jgi:hypothetical protein
MECLPPRQPPQVPQQSADEAPAATKGPSVSNAARKEVLALQTAVNAKDVAAIPAALAAAQAKAKTNDDRYVIAKLQLKAAVDANDTAAMTKGSRRCWPRATLNHRNFSPCTWAGQAAL